MFLPRANVKPSKFDLLYRESQRRKDMIRRAHPDATFRMCHGGPGWDYGAQSYVLVLLNDEEGRRYAQLDWELTLLEREVQRQHLVHAALSSSGDFWTNGKIQSVLTATACYYGLATEEARWVDSKPNRDKFLQALGVGSHAEGS